MPFDVAEAQQLASLIVHPAQQQPPPSLEDLLHQLATGASSDPLDTTRAIADAASAHGYL